MKAIVWRQAARAALGALFLGYLAMRSAQQLPEPAAGSNDSVTPVLHAFERASQHLPPFGRIGYLGSSDQRRYFLAQHALVPRVVVRGDQFEFVIVDQAAQAPAAPGLDGFQLIASDDGLSVYKKVR